MRDMYSIIESLTKTWDTQSIKQLIETNDKAVEKACVSLMKLQNIYDIENEGVAGKSRKYIVSFEKSKDFIVSCGKAVQGGKRLSDKQLSYAREVMKFMYSKLVDIANKKIDVDAVPVKFDPNKAPYSANEGKYDYIGFKGSNDKIDTVYGVWRGMDSTEKGKRVYGEIRVDSNMIFSGRLSPNESRMEWDDKDIDLLVKAGKAVFLKRVYNKYYEVRG